VSAKGRPERELLPLGGKARSAKGAPVTCGPNPWQQTSWDARAAGNFVCGGGGAGLIVFTALSGADGHTLSGLIAAGLGYMLTRTAFGRIIRAAADNREMAEALGVDMRGVYARVFTLGTALGTLGGALVIPATAAMSEMGIELIVEAFAVVVIGGLGSMRGALVGALVVGVLRSVAISVYPEIEMLLIYLIVIAVLLLRPRGLFGGAAA